MTTDKKPQFLVIDQPTIIFEHTPKVQSSSVLKLKNAHTTNVAFKIRTTSPDYYIVRPNQGILTPMETIAVTFTLKAIPNALELNHRFNIISAVTELSSSQVNEVAEFWKDTPKAKLQNYILNGVLLSSEEILMRKATASANQSVIRPLSTIYESSLDVSSHMESKEVSRKYTSLMKFHQLQSQEKSELERKLAMLQSEEKKKQEQTEADVASKAKQPQGISLMHLSFVFLVGLILGAILFRSK